MARTCIVFAAAIAGVLATTTPSRGQEVRGLTYGELITDGRNVAFRANAVGASSKTAAFEAAVRNLVRISKLDQDTGLAFWPASICQSANAAINGWCKLSPSRIKIAGRKPVIYLVPISINAR